MHNAHEAIFYPTRMQNKPRSGNGCCDRNLSFGCGNDRIVRPCIPERIPSPPPPRFIEKSCQRRTSSRCFKNKKEPVTNTPTMPDARKRSRILTYITLDCIIHKIHFTLFTTRLENNERIPGKMVFLSLDRLLHTPVGSRSERNPVMVGIGEENRTKNPFVSRKPAESGSRARFRCEKTAKPGATLPRCAPNETVSRPPKHRTVPGCAIDPRKRNEKKQTNRNRAGTNRDHPLANKTFSSRTISRFCKKG